MPTLLLVLKWDILLAEFAWGNRQQHTHRKNPTKLLHRDTQPLGVGVDLGFNRSELLPVPFPDHSSTVAYTVMDAPALALKIVKSRQIGDEGVPFLFGVAGDLEKTVLGLIRQDVVGGHISPFIDPNPILGPDDHLVVVHLNDAQRCGFRIRVWL